MGAWAALGALLALAGGAWAQQVSGPASAKAEAAPSLSPALRSPRSVVRTFNEGMINWQDGDPKGLEAALGCLDLSKIEKVVRTERGPVLAEKIRLVIDKTAPLRYEAIPDDPQYHTNDAAKAREYVIRRRPGEPGEVAVARQPDGQWLFTSETVASIEALAKALESAPFAAGAAPWKPRSGGLRLRSWVAQRAPFLLQEHLILGTWQWLGLLLVVLFGVAMGRLAPRALGAALGRWLTRADAQIRAELNAILTKPVSIAVAAWIWWLGLNLLDLPEGALIVLLAAVKLATALAVVWTLYRMAGALGHALAVRAARTGRIFDELLAPILAGSLKVFIVAFGLVFIADLFDLPLKSVLAGLGLGGLAVALAAKDVLSNVIGSLTILLDRPFKLGDWIVMDKVEGSVEAVGIRSTRLRTAHDSVVAIPNSQLMGGVIDNMGERRYRRLKCQISAACDTAPERIEAFCEGVREIIRRHPYTRKQDYHVWLNDLAPSSLNISLSCFLETPDGATELRERHRLLLDIIRLTRAMGVELALPPQAPSATSAMAGGKPPAPPAPEGLEEALRWGRQEARNVVARNLQTDSAPPPLVRFDFPEGES